MSTALQAASQPGLYDFLYNVSPYLAGAVGFVLVGIARFVWKNHRRSRENKSRLDRYGRSIFGDEQDVMHEGLSEQIKELSDKTDRLDSRLNSIERKIDRICADRDLN